MGQKADNCKMRENVSTVERGTCQGSRISTKAGTWQSRKLHDYTKKLEQFEQEDTGKRSIMLGEATTQKTSWIPKSNVCRVVWAVAEDGPVPEDSDTLSYGENGQKKSYL